MPAGSGVRWEKPGGFVIAGGVVSTSTTVTVKLFWPVLPCESVAVQVTVVGPSGNVLPEAGGRLGTIRPSRLSVALAGPRRAAPARGGAATRRQSRPGCTGPAGP